MTSLDEKLAKMQEILRSLKRVVVAFSAGVDSTFALKVAVDTLGAVNVVAVTAKSDSLAEAEFLEAVKLADQLGVEHVIIETREFDNPDYRANPANRCYYCRSELYERLDTFLVERGLCAAVSGINADDYADWRPGILAAREHGVRAPCAEAGMTKEDIRALSRRLGLPTFDKPAMPCLSSRIQYGEEITTEKLKRIERSEAFLRSLGFRECRVRHHHNLARIELPVSDLDRAMIPETRARIDAALREYGYQYVAIDLRGFRSGSMNEVIAFGERQKGD
ncbi:MAG TPA: ATP-dependent sacrificial sulfur transferase LarE [Phycisphaerae bacterium]|nr:ATP-dependent sacrificial sulfur transferase LarE [Phycisphaerae bacterium]HRY70161.1 ATP-dependent sacrificial sulfur transferase LarE [Phycisphaerae bacterium]HSA29682.1 ATP-dependent sacrificial sulfur transferase LarE [Phycisphaerae bacterium]